MADGEGWDRYNWFHRTDSEFTVGESMPGTVGDSDGTIHDRLGELPTLDEDAIENVSVPGEDAEEHPEQRSTAAGEERSHHDLDGETISVRLTGTENGDAVGHTNGYRVIVPEAEAGETVMVRLEAEGDHLRGERVRLFE